VNLLEKGGVLRELTSEGLQGTAHVILDCFPGDAERGGDFPVAQSVPVGKAVDESLLTRKILDGLFHRLPKLILVNSIGRANLETRPVLMLLFFLPLVPHLTAIEVVQRAVPNGPVEVRLDRPLRLPV